jgi:hypothetical protein
MRRISTLLLPLLALLAPLLAQARVQMLEAELAEAKKGVPK